MKKLTAVLCLFLLTSCAYYQVRFVNQRDNSVIYGDYSALGKTIWVRLPSGENLQGKYEPLQEKSVREDPDSLFYRSNISTFIGVFTPKGFSNKYAYLTGDKGTVMEIVFNYNDSANKGYGTARTNGGEEYRVEF